MQKAPIISWGLQWIGIRFLTRHWQTSWNTKVWTLQLLKACSQSPAYMAIHEQSGVIRGRVGREIGP